MGRFSTTESPLPDILPTASNRDPAILRFLNGSYHHAKESVKQDALGSATIEPGFRS